MTGAELLIVNAEIDGISPLDVAIRSGRIIRIGSSIACSGERIDAKGGALIPGLVDHHIHLLSLAAQKNSVALDCARGRDDCLARLSAAVAAVPAGHWLRVTGYHEITCGPLDGAALDKLAPNNPVRVQHQTGAFWQLNTQALLSVLGHEEAPVCFERAPSGAITGVVWRGDRWLGERIGRLLPPLDDISSMLSSYGITEVTDASASTDAVAVRHMRDEKRSGGLLQNLLLMSEGEIPPASEGEYKIGPVKILLDDSDLPDFDVVTARIADARRGARNVAVHCVTAAELAFALAAFDAGGTAEGDRIEHAGIISEEAIQEIAKRKLTVVTQSAFVHERGDRYLREVASRDLPHLYRAASLLRACIRLAGSSDAPYATPDPWKGIRAAIQRRTYSGVTLGGDECLTPIEALHLYLTPAVRPGGPAKAVRVGMKADLCLLQMPLAVALREPGAENVAATIIDGRIAYRPA